MSVEYKKALGVFGEITGTIGFNTSQAIENGWSNEKDEARQQKHRPKQQITLPPYTAAISGNNRKNRRQ